MLDWQELRATMIVPLGRPPAAIVRRVQVGLWDLMSCISQQPGKHPPGAAGIDSELGDQPGHVLGAVEVALNGLRGALPPPLPYPALVVRRRNWWC